MGPADPDKDDGRKKEQERKRQSECPMLLYYVVDATGCALHKQTFIKSAVPHFYHMAIKNIFFPHTTFLHLPGLSPRLRSC